MLAAGERSEPAEIVSYQIGACVAGGTTCRPLTRALNVLPFATPGSLRSPGANGLSRALRAQASRVITQNAILTF